MKLDIPIVLIDESVVDYGFRVLMSGYVSEPFAKNPVLLLQHGRLGEGINGVNNMQLMPLGKWNDVKPKDGQLLAFPEFDDDDADAIKVQKKVQKGYYNAASIWIDPIEVSDDEKLMLPGQYGPTIIKWAIREASIVDIPNCRNAVAIRNSAGAKVLLNGNNAVDAENINNYLKTFLKNTSIFMDNKLLAKTLGLSENATDADISAKLSALNNANTQVENLTLENTKLKGDVSSKVTEINNLKTAAETKKMEDLEIVMKAKKLTSPEIEKYKKLAAVDFTTVKEIVDGLPSFDSIENKLSAGGNGAVAGSDEEVKELMKLSGHDLYMQDKFPRLQALSPEHFKLKYKEYYGHDLPA